MGGRRRFEGAGTARGLLRRVNLYRYSIRLSAYYDARADSLELIDVGINPETFQKYATAVSPDVLDIGKPPKLPTEYAVDIAKAAVGKIGGGSKE
jgi:hypothetical protein